MAAEINQEIELEIAYVLFIDVGIRVERSQKPPRAVMQVSDLFAGQASV